MYHIIDKTIGEAVYTSASHLEIARELLSYNGRKHIIEIKNDRQCLFISDNTGKMRQARYGLDDIVSYHTNDHDARSDIADQVVSAAINGCDWLQQVVLAPLS